MPSPQSILISDLLHGYRTGRETPASVIEPLLDASADGRGVWITRLSRADVMARVAALDRAAIDRLPLYGIPFVIKDNIDLAGTATTAGCPGFAYTPAQSAFVVQRLLDAGAIPLGKTNLDQFATGLVGTRSPYGPCRNSFNADFISGGSSSGSAVGVATGLASFSLGTDTAGSGRVPAAFNNIVGLKPSNGRLSTRGVVPACRSLDCVSVFALTSEDAGSVLDTAEGYDAADPYSRKIGDRGLNGWRVGVPRRDQLQFFGDGEYARLFDAAVRRLESLGGDVKEIDFVATPTAGTIYRLAELEADPLRLNANLGYYTNFMNLFDLSGVAVPAGFRADGLPFGITLVGPRGADRDLLHVAGQVQRASVTTLGALHVPLPHRPVPPGRLRAGFMPLAVCGAHMQGLPLNHQLRDRGGYLIHATTTAPRYRLFALPGGPPHRPGIMRVLKDGARIELEVWALPTDQVGSFIAAIPAPLGMGKIELDSGALVTGFLCEGYASEGAADITSYGGWR